ncbi:hypothetical protein NDU88_005689 [Pleurodeles waltl]|uniref:Uncharacterized protein n=1 Tax=Pleurodeles waltl TaxID=8319 RepID=A0AAV7WCM3_PLEWA|nr:hypothetical protein NDU88_005689 [Pleurodeles waltl]
MFGHDALCTIFTVLFEEEDFLFVLEDDEGYSKVLGAPVTRFDEFVDNPAMMLLIRYVTSRPEFCITTGRSELPIVSAK